jgi:hypothetical protein
VYFQSFFSWFALVPLMMHKPCFFKSWFHFLRCTVGHILSHRNSKPVGHQWQWPPRNHSYII